MFNVLAQSNQLRRALEYKEQTGGEEAKKEIADLAQKAAVGGAVVACYALAAPSLKAMMPAGTMP